MLNDSDLPFVKGGPEEYFSCMCEGEFVELTRLIADFARDSGGHLYKYLPGENNEAKKIGHFTPDKMVKSFRFPKLVTGDVLRVREGYLKLLCPEDFLDFLDLVLAGCKDQ